MMTEQKFAVQGRSHAEGEVLFEQTIKGWLDCGFEYSQRTIEGVFWHSANCAQIKFSVRDKFPGVAWTDAPFKLGTIILSEQDAITFALNIAPKEVKQKVELFDEMSDLLQRIESWGNETGEVPLGISTDVGALMNKIRSIGKD